MIGLVWHAGIFGTGAGWLRDISYESSLERVGLTAVVGLFSLAVCGVYWLALPFLLRLIARRTPLRSQIVAAALWLTLVQVDFYFRDEVLEIAGGGFGAAEFSGSVGDVFLVLRRIVHWFGWRLVWGVGQSAAVFWFLLYCMKVIR